jgi:hypothetical protein
MATACSHKSAINPYGKRKIVVRYNKGLHPTSTCEVGSDSDVYG